MLTATIDFSATASDIAQLTFPDVEQLSEVELAIWSPLALFTQSADAIERHLDTEVLKPLASLELLAGARRLRDALRELLGRGGTVVAFVPTPRVLAVHTPQDIVHFQPLEALPGPVIQLNAVDDLAPSLACQAGEPFGSFFARCAQWLRPLATLVSPPGHSICTVAAEKASGGAFDYHHPGRILLLPAPLPDLPMEARNALIEEIRGLARKLDPHASSALLPAWARDTITPTEAALREQVSRLGRVLAATQHDLRQARTELREIEQVRALEAGAGDGMAAALSVALYRLGAYPQAHGGDRSHVAFEVNGRAGMFMPVDGAIIDPDKIIEQAKRCARDIGDELGLPVGPVLLFVGENALHPRERNGPPAPLSGAAESAGIPLLTGSALVDAWVHGRSSLLIELLAGQTPS